MSVKSIASVHCPAFLKPTFGRIENSPIGYRLARGVFWSLAGVLASRGLMFIATVFVARILGRTVYGQLGMVQSTVSMFGLFAGFGMGLTATKYVAEYRETDRPRAGRIIRLTEMFAVATAGLMALALLAFAPWLANRTLNAPHLTSVLRIGTLILFISALNGAQAGALAGFEAFKTIAGVNLLVGLISFPLLVGGAYFGGLSGSVWALVVNLGASWVLNQIALHKEARRYRVPLALGNSDGGDLPVLWRFSLPAVLAGSMVAPVDWACNAMLVNRPHGYGEMGVYGAANQLYSMLLFLPTLFGQVVLPILSERLGHKDVRRSTQTMLVAMKANALCVVPFIVVASILSPYIMRLFGEGFKDGWPTLIVVLWTAALYAIQAPVGQIIQASGKMWTGFFMNLGWATAFVLGTFVLVKDGAFGLAGARGIAYLLHSVWIFLFARYLLGVGKIRPAKQVDAESG